MREGRILVVDDEGPQREILRTILSAEAIRLKRHREGRRPYGAARRNRMTWC